jgi:hypothetical protein
MDDTNSVSADAEKTEKRGPVLFSKSLTALPSCDCDTGWKPGRSPLQMRFEMGMGADISSTVWGEFQLTYSGLDDANLILPDNNAAGGNLEMDFGLEMSTRGRVNVDLGVKEFDFKFNIPGAPNFDLRCRDSNSFDLYLLDGSKVSVRDYIDPQELYSVSLAGIKGIVDISAGVYADMELWAEMSADSITTTSQSDPNERCRFESVGDACSVTIEAGGTYDADACYNEDLDVGVTITFYPSICANLDTWIYEWDYCVSPFGLPLDLVSGPVDLDLSSDLSFEKTYDLLIVGYPGGTTEPNAGIYSYDANCDVFVEVDQIEPDYDFDYWFDFWVDKDGVEGSNTIVDTNCWIILDDNTPWHTLHPIFFLADATKPFPIDGQDKVSTETFLNWAPGEHVADENGHKLYFDTDFNDVNTLNPSAYQGDWTFESYDTNDYDANALARCKTYYWRVVEVNDTYVGAGSPPWKGSPWRLTTVGCRASEPDPAEGHQDVATRVVLRWTPGVCALWHEVYFGTDYNDVNDANTSTTGIYQGRQARDANTFDTNDYDSNGLLIGTTYYWRIDEVNDTYPYIGPPTRRPWKGPVWQFTVSHISVDDFESYSDTSSLQATWKDGLQNDTGSLIWLGIAPGDPVYTGRQSMIYYYDNRINWGMGYYSEVERSFNPPQDWTEQGVEALVLYFRCGSDNDTEQMYVGLEDDVLGFGAVKASADANDANEWNIDLNDPCFQFVNMNSISKIYIGFGKREDIIPRFTTGTTWFDDIRLYPPRCCPDCPDCAAPQGDIAGYDCLVNEVDLSVMARDWLMTDYFVVAEAPEPNLIVEYTFDDHNLADTSGNDYHGDSCGTSVAYQDKALLLDGNSFVNIPLGPNNPFNGLGSFSIAMQFRVQKKNQPGILISSARDNNPLNHSMALFASSWERDQGVLLHGNFWVDTVGVQGNPLDGDWHHAAVTYDIQTQTHRVYLDGAVGWYGQFDPNIPNIADDKVRIGASLNPKFPDARATGNFVGDVNSVRIYDYALSPEEVCYLTQEHVMGFCYEPLKSPANLYPRKAQPPTYPDDPNNPYESDVVNYKDYAVLAENWLEEILWP